MPNVDVIVLGGGPAGLAAAAALGRALRSVTVVDAGQPRNAAGPHVHNLLGREGVSPSELLATGRRELEGYGGSVTVGRVTGLRAEGAGVGVTLDDGRVLTARRAVVATGLTDLLPDLPGLWQRWGVDVVHCPYWHGYEVRGRRLVLLPLPGLAEHTVTLWSQWSRDLTVVADVDWPTQMRLRALGVTVEAGTAVNVEGAGVTLADGRRLDADAVVLGVRCAANIEGLDLPTVDLVVGGVILGSYVATDEQGRTGVAGVYAVGNAADPRDTVASAAAGGVRVAASINADLTAEDIAAELAPARFWDGFYADRPQVWSGNVNPTLARETENLPPGRALDLGCGEGADAIWLARRGWRVVALDASRVALERAAAHASAAGVRDRIEFRQVSLDASAPPAETSFDLVSAQFFLSPVAEGNAQLETLRAAATLVGPGGTLTIGTHLQAHHGVELPSLAEHRERLALRDGWELVTEAPVARTITMADGSEHHGQDGILTLRRR